MSAATPTMLTKRATDSPGVGSPGTNTIKTLQVLQALSNDASARLIEANDKIKAAQRSGDEESVEIWRDIRATTLQLMKTCTAQLKDIEGASTGAACATGCETAPVGSTFVEAEEQELYPRGKTKLAATSAPTAASTTRPVIWSADAPLPPPTMSPTKTSAVQQQHSQGYGPRPPPSSHRRPRHPGQGHNLFSTGLNGDWRSDKDMQHRKWVIQHIARLYKQNDKNLSQEMLIKLHQIFKQLELSLYRSATSFEAYADTSTLKHRIQLLAMEKKQQAKHSKAKNRATLGGDMAGLRRAMAVSENSAAACGFVSPYATDQHTPLPNHTVRPYTRAGPNLHKANDLSFQRTTSI